MSLTDLDIGEMTGLTKGEDRVADGMPRFEILLEVGLKHASPQQDAGYLASPYKSTPNPIPTD